MSKKSKKKQPAEPKQQQPNAKPAKSFPRWIFPFLIIVFFAMVGFVVLRFYQNSDKRKVLSSLSQLNLNGTEPQVVTKIKNAEEEVKKNPGSADAWGKLAMNLDVHDFSDEAIPIYREATTLNPSDFRWPYFISVLLAKNGDVQSLDWFERARKIKPDYVPMLVNYGNALFQFNKNDQAANEYNQAISYDAKCAHAYFGLARIEFAQGKLNDSAKNLKQALQINPGYSEASNLLMTVCNRLKSSDCVVSLAINSPYKTGKPLIVILMNGRPLTISWMVEKASAILETWFLGIEAGNAITDVLFGDVNPSGKLPITFPRNVGQIPIYYNHKNTGRPMSDDMYTSKYIDSPQTPLYPFGFGLSYTSFAYENISVNPKQMGRNGNLIVSVDVTNTGKVAGEEIVQLYIQDKVASITRPVKELKDFKKINLQPGEKTTVQFMLRPEQLAFYNLDMKWTIEPGMFNVFVGGNSQDVLQSEYELR